MSLLAEIQILTERLYGSTGVNFENFLIGRERFHYLSQFDVNSRELSDLARVFFRVQQDRLYLGIYYSAAVVDALETHDPRRGLSERNIAAFCVFVEEINHAVHGALKFMEGRAIGEDGFAHDLELQAKIDLYFVLKYFLAYFNTSGQLESMDRLWIRYHLFECEDSFYRSARLTQRYSKALHFGDKYTRFVDGLPPAERLQEIRRFRALPYAAKCRYIQMLP
jgi:hypothetical protein